LSARCSTVRADCRRIPLVPAAFEVATAVEAVVLVDDDGEDARTLGYVRARPLLGRHPHMSVSLLVAVVFVLRIGVRVFCRAFLFDGPPIAGFAGFVPPDEGISRFDAFVSAEGAGEARVVVLCDGRFGYLPIIFITHMQIAYAWLLEKYLSVYAKCICRTNIVVGRIENR
jgi:hypothetical protein